MAKLAMNGQRKNQALAAASGLSTIGTSVLKQLIELTGYIEEGRGASRLKERILRLIQEAEHQWQLQQKQPLTRPETTSKHVKEQTSSSIAKIEENYKNSSRP